MTNTVWKTIEQNNSNLSKWYASGNVNKIVEVFAEDCWQMPPYSEPLVGRKALRDFWVQACEWGNWELSLNIEDVVVSENIAVERGSYVLNFSAGINAPAGMESNEDLGNYVVMWRLEADNQWRIVWDAPVSKIPRKSGR